MGLFYVEKFTFYTYNFMAMLTVFLFTQDLKENYIKSYIILQAYQ